VEPDDAGPPRSVVLILVVNAGSSNLKLRVVDDHDVVVASAGVDTPTGHLDRSAVADALEDLGRFEAAGHRVVHGGPRFVEPVLVDDDVLAELDDLVRLAPLHQPPALALIRVLRELRPGLTSVACFDTAFHATLPPAAATFAVPADWRDGLGVRRYGFHGLSHGWAAERAATMLAVGPADLRVVTSHLGSGASLAAVRGGVSVDTTMGFTPLDGLVMATRSGALDPGLVLWLANTAGLATSEIEDCLVRRSGLLGLAGTADMREVVNRADAGDVDAALALDVYLHRLRAGVAAMAAAAGGLDVLVFTGGVGEHSPVVRERAASGLAWLGVTIDAAANASAEGDTDLSAPGARVRTLVVEAREDLAIARGVRRVLG
jgi:acetate kinase